jgi:hypothetical protein
MPPLMPAAKLRPVRPSTTTRPPVSSHTVIADAFDDGVGATVAHGKAFARDPAHEGLAVAP